VTTGRPPSSQLEAHLEAVDHLRQRLATVQGWLAAQGVLVPAPVSAALAEALRECRRLEGIGTDWEQAADRLAGMLVEAQGAGGDW
jgi:hypothetical protein